VRLPGGFQLAGSRLGFVFAEKVIQGDAQSAFRQDLGLKLPRLGLHALPDLRSAFQTGLASLGRGQTPDLGLDPIQFPDLGDEPDRLGQILPQRLIKTPAGVRIHFEYYGFHQSCLDLLPFVESRTEKGGFGMKRLSTTVLVLTAALTLALPSLVDLRAGSQGTNRPSSNQLQLKEVKAKDALPEPTDPNERELRRLKGRRFDKGGPPFSNYPEGVNPDDEDIYYFREMAPPALPAKDSNLVIAGVVNEQQPYLSANQAGIYTEFKIRVEQVFKADRIPNTQPVEILAVREGGSIRLPSGREFSFKVTQKPPAEEGKRYVFFLKCNALEQDFSILTQYEISDGKVIPTDSYRTEPDGKLPFDGWDEKSFLEEVERSAMDAR